MEGLALGAVFEPCLTVFRIIKNTFTRTLITRVPTRRTYRLEAESNIRKEMSGSLNGSQTKLPLNATAENIRSLVRENESAKILSQNGYHVEQNLITSGAKNPDCKINSEIFDNYAPSSSNIRNIWREVDKKVQKAQTNSVVINLADSKATVADLQKQFKNWPVKGLDKVIVIDQSGKTVRIK